jgi:hypothetical protein
LAFSTSAPTPSANALARFTPSISAALQDLPDLAHRLIEGSLVGLCHHAGAAPTPDANRLIVPIGKQDRAGRTTLRQKQEAKT